MEKKNMELQNMHKDSTFNPLHKSFEDTKNVDQNEIGAGNSDDSNKSVGLVYISCASREQTICREYNFKGNRDEIRSKTVEAAFNLLLELIDHL